MPQKVEIKYTQPANYRPTFVNGAFGGINPQKQLVVNFYFENNPTPESQTFELNENGKLGNELERKPESDILYINREITTGIILDLESAKRISNWLNNKITQLEEIKKQEDGET